MNDSPGDVWYCTRGGEVEGPIDFSKLKAKTGNYMLRPPVEMVWTDGMDDWKSVAEIEGLCETLGPPLPAITGEPAGDAWFYVLEGEPVGPVSLSELKERIADPSIEPPLSLVWTAGMHRWMPVYAVEALCEPVVGMAAGIAHLFSRSKARGIPMAEPDEAAEKKQAADSRIPAKNAEENAAAQAGEEEERQAAAQIRIAAMDALAKSEAKAAAAMKARVE